MDFTQKQKYEILAEQLKKEDGLEELLKATFKFIMQAEQEEYVRETGDYRNGYRPRKITGYGRIFELQVPRVRQGTFRPMLLGVLKSEEEECRKLAFALYSEGLTTSQVGRIYERIYGRCYSTSQVSRMFEFARGEAQAWQNRPLEEYYPILYIDATFVMTRRGGECGKEAFYTILAVRADGSREVLAIVNSPTESATFWHEIFHGLKRRGMRRTTLVVSDGLKGIEDTIAEEWNGAAVQLCAVHLMRECVAQVKPADRREVTEDLKSVFRTGERGRTMQAGYADWQALCRKWGRRYPAFKSKGQDERYLLYFSFLMYDPRIQSMIYTTNWIERLNRDHKRVLKMRGAMPDIDSVILLMCNVAISRTAYSRRITAFFNDTEHFDWEK